MVGKFFQLLPFIVKQTRQPLAKGSRNNVRHLSPRMPDEGGTELAESTWFVCYKLYGFYIIQERWMLFWKIMLSSEFRFQIIRDAYVGVPVWNSIKYTCAAQPEGPKISSLRMGCIIAFFFGWNIRDTKSGRSVTASSWPCTNTSRLT